MNYISATRTAVRVARMTTPQWNLSMLHSKKECVYPIPVFENYEAVSSVLFEYVHSFYNRKRIHSSLSYQTPLQVEITTIANQIAS